MHKYINIYKLHYNQHKTIKSILGIIELQTGEDLWDCESLIMNETLKPLH